MKTISMLEFRKNTGKIIRWSQQGQRMTVTYRGKPVMKIEPIEPENATADDPFFKLCSYSDSSGGSLSNKEMDTLIYGV